MHFPPHILQSHPLVTFQDKFINLKLFCFLFRMSQLFWFVTSQFLVCHILHLNTMLFHQRDAEAQGKI